MPRSRTPAAPREPYQNGSSVLTSSTFTLWSTALMSLTGLNCLGKVRLPCGLRHSLCTLHLFRFACLHQPVKTGVQSATPTEAQHSIRAAGQALPGRDFHPARSTKLCLAHQCRRLNGPDVPVHLFGNRGARDRRQILVAELRIIARLGDCTHSD